MKYSRMKYFLGVDFGGGASKATLLDEKGGIVCTAMSEYPTDYPHPGWAEQDPRCWYDALKENVRTVLGKSGVKNGDIAALCVDAATHIAVLCDAENRPLRKAIYWTDTRSISEAEKLRGEAGALIREQTLHEPGTVWTLPQMLWVKNREPEIWEKTQRIFFAKDYIRFLLTGEYATDTIEAQGSMFFNYHKKQWSPELCALIGLDMDLLPSLLKPADIAGKILPGPAEDLGLKAGTPVAAGATDTALEVFAAGCIRGGDMTVKLATAGRICVVTGRAYISPHIINYSHIKEGLWYPGTATKSCAASLRWYRDVFGGDYRRMDGEAAIIAPGCEGLLFHPYLNGELTPYQDPLLRASFTGIRAGHTRAHFNRAVLEGAAFTMLACMGELENLGIPHAARGRIIGGGAKSPLWRQIVSDALGISLGYPENCDSSLGAAMLAGLAAGFFSSCDEAVERCCSVSSVTEPDARNHRIYGEYFTLFRETHDALAPLCRRVPEPKP
jgi:xylulokinase